MCPSGRMGCVIPPANSTSSSPPSTAKDRGLSSPYHRYHGDVEAPVMMMTAQEMKDFTCTVQMDGEISEPDQQTFETALHAHTNPGILLRSLSSNSFRQVSSFLLDMNHQEYSTIILEFMKDIWENPQLFHLVKDYIDKCLHKSDFCMTLESYLKWAGEAPLQHFEAEESGSTSNREKYSRMLEELKNLAARDPLMEEFLQKLELCKSTIKERLEFVKRWRKVSCIIFESVFLFVVICAVVTSAVAAPRVGAALAASAPLVSMIRWFHSFWKDSEVALEGQKEMISSMWAGTYITMKDMNSIQLLVDKLKIEMEQLLQVADYSPIDEEAAKKLGVFKKSLEDFGNHINCCIEKTGIRSKKMVQMMIKHTN